MVGVGAPQVEIKTSVRHYARTQAKSMSGDRDDVLDLRTACCLQIGTLVVELYTNHAPKVRVPAAVAFSMQQAMHCLMFNWLTVRRCFGRR